VIGAAVDIGSNSVHLLVSQLSDGGLRPLVDQSELIGLGDAVDRDGRIPPPAVDELVRVLSHYRDVARTTGAQKVTFLGTEPFRRAVNSRQVAEQVETRVGVPLAVLSLEQEGRLTFAGVTAGRLPTASLLVVDIGGGSTELVDYEPPADLRVIGLSTGSARLTARHIEHDPPAATEVENLRRAAADAMAGLPVLRPARATFVGGTATNLVKLAPLSLSAFEQVFATLAATPAAELCERYTLRPRRAAQLAAGAALTEALLNHCRLTVADVSPASLRDGAILESLDRDEG
jgi:exopolyphosphatase/guanosine-5'-triphosphate,3'-diphosphate pyrophosphatase